MKAVVVVQARLASTRLPRKALEMIGGLPMVHHVLLRANAIKNVAEVRLAIPEGDIELVDVATDVGVRAIQGHPTDVLKRFEQVLHRSGADIIMRVTGDCPLLAPDICERVLEEAVKVMASTSCEFVCNDTSVSGYPDGTDCEVFSVNALRKALIYSDQAYDREHVTPWMRRSLTNMIVHAPQRERRCHKWSVDTVEDLSFVRKINRRLRVGRYNYGETLLAHRRVLREDT